ncbi:MAG: methylated-DNA--[protein]-cysteine S-methyltransferase [Limisphaerales bacterium]
MKTNQTYVAMLKIKTDDGYFVARYSSAGLARLDFPTARSKGATTMPVAPAVRRWHELTTRAMNQALQGRPIAAPPPLDLAGGTAFQRKVWAALRAIPAGKTRTYAQLAASLKNPKAARAVGAACGANPVPLLIPCHRVVAAHGALGGFSGGLPWKRKLLGREKGNGPGEPL